MRPAIDRLRADLVKALKPFASLIQRVASLFATICKYAQWLMARAIECPLRFDARWSLRSNEVSFTDSCPPCHHGLRSGRRQSAPFLHIGIALERAELRQ